MMADKKQITRLLKTARGQIDGILIMVENNRYCLDIVNQVSASQSILRKVNREILKSHLHNCVKDAFLSGNEDESLRKIEEIIKYLENSEK